MSYRDTLSRFGVSTDGSFDRYVPLFSSIASDNAGPDPVGCSATPDNIGAHLAFRGILYPASSCTNPGQSAGNTARIETTVLSMASAIAQVPGVGSLLSAIFQHHAQAVATEQAVSCQVSQIADQAIPQIDAAVRSGQISAAQGVAALEQVSNQLHQMLGTISGAGSAGHPCNAGCCYGHVLDAHVEFARTYYMDISPLSSAAAVNPATYAPLAPASTGYSIADQLFPPSGSAYIQPGGSSTWVLLAIGAAIIFVILLLRK